MSELHLYDFGIFLELEPDEEEKAMLENNIQQAMQQGSIELEDAVDLRMVKNINLANQMLKLRRKRKGETDHQREIEKTAAQGEAQAKAAAAASQAEIQKNEAMYQTQRKLKELENQHAQTLLVQQTNMKKDLLAQEFQQDMQLKQMEGVALKDRDNSKEDRKDTRTKIQATQQSELIDQRKNEKPPKNFEEAGNDLLGGFNLGV